MIKKLFTLLFFLNISFAYAQTIKTDVLVIGGTPSGVAAAIQSARSKVKTILVERGSKLTSYFITEGKEVIKADTVKNLSIELNTDFTDITRDGDHWEVTCLVNGKAETLKARIVVDATARADVVTKAGVKYILPNFFENGNKSIVYRTSVAAGNDLLLCCDTIDHGRTYPSLPAFIIPMKSLLAQGADNLLVTGKLFHGPESAYLPLQLSVGQGAGVIAAYCAFFKTTTANLRVRTIQTELLDFKGSLLPFEDIAADPEWRAIQQVCATGMLKGVREIINGKSEFIFNPYSVVTTAEVKPVFLEIYTRAFLWFNKEKPGKDFTLGNLLSLISELTLTDPDVLQKNISREWKTQYKFKSDFDVNKPITRREFAILVNKYLNPFARTVDLDGKIVN